MRQTPRTGKSKGRQIQVGVENKSWPLMMTMVIAWGVDAAHELLIIEGCRALDLGIILVRVDRQAKGALKVKVKVPQ